MTELKIGTFNLRNHYWKRNWDGEEFHQQLANFIKQENIDLLGVQELVKLYSKNLKQYLGTDYNIYGKYCYGKIPFIDQFNEANSIITNQPILITETKYLSTIPILDHLTQNSRILTSILTKEHFMINTHIEYITKTSQIHQLKLLYNYILKYKQFHPIITGDFNMDTSMLHFQEFINALKKIGIQYVENNTPTYKTKEQILDHIFISDAYSIKSIEVIQENPINEISDHRPLLIKIRKK